MPRILSDKWAMSAETHLLLAAIVIVIAFILVGIVARQRRTARFSSAPPTTPLVLAALDRVRKEAAAVRLGGHACLAAALEGSGLSPAVANITRSMAGIETLLARTPPSLANATRVYESLFQGLVGNVQPVAAGLVAAGRERQKAATLFPAVNSEECARRTIEANARAESDGNALIATASRIQALATAVHNLGVSLNLE